MKKMILFLALLPLLGCSNSTDSGYDNSADIAYLEENAQKENVTVTESGLQYEVIEEGDGERPSANSTVRVDYEGSFIDGTIFDSSYARGEPSEFGLQGVITGWTEGLQLMREGSTYRFVIPADLAYGDGFQSIYPGATLIFKVELLKILD